jgi:hypothetical protein
MWRSAVIYLRFDLPAACVASGRLDMGSMGVDILNFKPQTTDHTWTTVPAMPASHGQFGR